MTHDELLDLARELTARREPHALITVVRAVAPTSAYVGAQAIVLADGTSARLDRRRLCEGRGDRRRARRDRQG